MTVFKFNRAIVRQPAESVVDGLRAGDHEGPSFAGVSAEHDAYVAALKQAGLQVTVLPPLAAFPDSMFVEDPAVVFTEGAILLRPGTPTREQESAALREVLSTEFDIVLDLPVGHVDGGDVLVTPEKVLVGLSDRTDETGAAALIDLLGRFGRRGEIAQTPAKTLHFKTACSILDEETILATEALAGSTVFKGFRVLTVPPDEPGGANVLRLNDQVLVGATFPRTRDILLDHGFSLTPLDVREIGKIDAGLTCMSLRWYDRGAIAVSQRRDRETLHRG